ncbi:prefoldin subunit beta [candidate division MSBL1 archaeon SCGC-AAA261G05]|nr:prefoldin subunit beta [candidate division MSBL1 archaeon SCGC-AAA261C02]KXB04157.1 prefoldin subunit beta [candidate division MSBL1 archaeon SCGC-AAA261G05]KXB04380.1 prefoldin subunit beta [candidate division MSBL1 archaeon SCGC-AAA261O19]
MEELPPQVQHQLTQFQQTQQRAQALATQRRQLEINLRETERALKELENLGEDATLYKSVGRIMAETNSSNAKEELEDRKETLDLRVKTVERQQERINKKMEEMRAKIQDALRGQ